ncbi:hypothetical protein EI42_06349 [Thermosporothrix hazakensis]|uniref:Uncharacterized protein n=1 Tax=Thermosporothrix hazakensis TaxID=644383 RepID=A0A326TQH3_THEHA|nr:hypothetical protein EI42_06349 [Thermosporothrix hazakensis]
MQTFHIVHLFNKNGQICLGILKTLILFQVHFFLLECLEERLSFGIVIRIVHIRHADHGTNLRSCSTESRLAY